MTPALIPCDFKPCICAVASEAVISYDGRSYCSARCVDRRGCDHAGCNCGKFPPEPPIPPFDRHVP